MHLWTHKRRWHPKEKGIATKREKAIAPLLHFQLHYIHVLYILEIVIVEFDFTIFQMPIYVGIVVVKQRERNLPVSL
jgi:hypothetical protein